MSISPKLVWIRGSDVNFANRIGEICRRNRRKTPRNSEEERRPGCTASYLLTNDPIREKKKYSRGSSFEIGGGMKNLFADKKRPSLRFGDFTLCLDQHALFNNQERVRITEKPLETLIYLVENRGRVLEKAEILNAVWKGTFVTEDTLVHAVGDIRRALGDDKDAPNFVQTVPRQGYRFIGEVFVDPTSEEDKTYEIDGLNLIESDFGGRSSGLARPAARSRMAVLLGSAGLLVIVFSAVYFFVYKPRPPLRSKSETQRQLTAGEFSAAKPAFSPDGKMMLCVWSSDETKGYGDIFVIAEDGRSIRVTTRMNPGGDMPVFTADGNYIVFSRYRDGVTGDRLPDLYIVPSSGHTEPRIYIPEAAGAGFSSDGKFVAYTKYDPPRNPLWLSPSANLERHSEIADVGFTPRFSPDGKWLAYTTSNPDRGLGDLWVVDTATFTDRRNLTTEPQQLYGLTWTSDSRSIIFSSKRSGIHLLWQASLDGDEIKPLMPTFGGYAIAPSFSPDGKTLVFQYGRIAKNILLYENGLKTTDVLTADELHAWVRFSPSGARIASIVQRHDFGKDIAIFEPGNERSDRKSKRFSLVDHNPAYLSWLDDEHIAYLNHDLQYHQTRVVIFNALNGMVTPLTYFEGVAEWLAVRPGGKSIAVVTVDANGKQRIVLRDLETQIDRIVAEGGEYAALRWLTDGSALTWSGPNRTAGSTSNGVWMWSEGVTGPVKIIDDGFGPIISSDKNAVYYSKAGEKNGLWMKDRTERQILTWADNVEYFDVAGDRVAYIQANETVKAQIYSVELQK